MGLLIMLLFGATLATAYTEDCLENHRTAATQVTAKLNIHLEDPVSTKTV
jgi:hypothetical protein